MARLLVIEDNPDNMELMTYLLKAFGHQVASAMDGAAGLALARCEPPDLIVCDVHLPKVDGYEVARQLKSDPVLRRIPLLAVTALAMVGDRDKVLASGFDGYLAKPIDPSEFVHQVESYLPAVLSVPSAPSTVANPVREKGAKVESMPSAPKAAVAGSRRILVVDDNMANRELVRATLEPAGFAVTLARNVPEALMLIRQESFDLIVSDLHMPNEDGYDFLRAVQNDPHLRATPFMCITSSVWQERDRQRMLALGAARFMLRPVEPQALRAEIEACLSGTRA